MMFDDDQYIQRVGLRARVRPNEAGLEDIHRQQVYSLPFENFDILLGRQIALDEAALFSKMVQNPRGGYCFELNGLLQIALSRFGFQSRPLLARVHVASHVGGHVTGREHQLLLVTINNRDWIADVGFGANGLRAPIPFEPGQERVQDGDTYRLMPHELYGTMLQQRADEGWQNLYSFDLTPALPADIELGNYFTSNNPKSFFTYTRVATRPIRRAGPRSPITP